jgi:hypothetical protein
MNTSRKNMRRDREGMSQFVIASQRVARTRPVGSQ